MEEVCTPARKCHDFQFLETFSAWDDIHSVTHSVTQSNGTKRSICHERTNQPSNGNDSFSAVIVLWANFWQHFSPPQKNAIIPSQKSFVIEVKVLWRWDSLTFNFLSISIRSSAIENWMYEEFDWITSGDGYEWWRAIFWCWWWWCCCCRCCIQMYHEIWLSCYDGKAH